MPKYAILVIDMLEEFVKGALKIERAERIVPNIKKLIERAREKKVPVIYVNDAHLPQVDAEFKLWGAHAVKGTPGAEVVEELKPREGDFVVEKRRYSGFFDTDLDLLLRELGADTLILTGIATDICVKHTAADAFFRGYKIIVVEDCTESFTEKDHKWAIGYMKKIYGAEILTVDKVLEKLSEL